MNVKSELKKLLRLDDEPGKIALSFAVGIFITFSPFYGLHTILGILLFTLFRLNKVAVLIGAALNLPWFTPGVYFPCYWVGAHLWKLFPWLDSTELFTWADFTLFFTSWANFKTLFIASNFLRVFLPTLLGTSIVGAIAAFASFYLVRHVIVLRRSRCGRNLPLSESLPVCPDQGV
jgi:uncharacterized protein